MSKTAPKLKKKKVTKKTPVKKVVKKKATKKTAKKRAPAKKKDIIVQSPVNPDIRLVVASEMADDSMIEQELMGEVLPYFVYTFKNGGKDVTGLTVKGVNEVVRRVNRDKKSGYNIRISPDHLKIDRNVEEDGEKGVEVSVYAENLLDGNSAWGIKFEPYYKKGRNGRYQNTFAVEKALSKAERNAKRKLIPEQVATKMIEKMINFDPNTVKQIDAPTHYTQAIKPAKPVASTPAEVFALVKTAIERAKDIDMVVQLDNQAQKSDKFTDDQKSEIRALASQRADAMSIK